MFGSTLDKPELRVDMGREAVECPCVNRNYITELSPQAPPAGAGLNRTKLLAQGMKPISTLTEGQRVKGRSVFANNNQSHKS